ncbi:SipW-cognate class signal peptide domain protein [Bacillus clarus]|uniref:SipW-cognate class signal peptide domain protein n=1 Tax=Bacillus clarus TaxID=2338372 RepID=A0A090YV95_9BACI|nr:SipW-cognate class signal peptide domain protein [Bacillus clarus]
MGVVTASLGLSLTSSGVFAYFNDSETSNNSFQAGTLDLSVHPTVIVDVKDLKLGDFIERNLSSKIKELLEKRSGCSKITIICRKIKKRYISRYFKKMRTNS